MILKLTLVLAALTAAVVVAILIANARDPYGGVLADPDDLA